MSNEIDHRVHQPSADHAHHEGCGCFSAMFDRPLDRRRMLGTVAGAIGVGMAAMMMPRWVMGAEGNYEAMLLTCIDPRFTELPHAYMNARQWKGKYSHFSFAGAAIGVVAPSFADWKTAFWDNLATSIQLHHIRAIVALNHRACGAAKIAYGEAKVNSFDVETETHRAALAEFRRQVREQQPKLQVITGLMSLEGNIIEIFS
jgi:hypothetical protein